MLIHVGREHYSRDIRSNAGASPGGATQLELGVTGVYQNLSTGLNM
jgi:hypothetical protein